MRNGPTGGAWEGKFMTIADSQCPVWRARGCSKLRKNKHEYTVTRSANDQSIYRRPGLLIATTMI